MKTLRKYADRILLGYNDNEPIYLSAPSWDCGWYWGFGYLGNRNRHYHLSSLFKNKNLYDGLKEHFKETLRLRNTDKWVFAELIRTFYYLKDTAEVLGRGGSHLSSNPCEDIIINKEEVKRINEIVLPKIFDEIYNILESNMNNDSLFKKLVSIDDEGSTIATIEFMKENNLKPDDIKLVEDNKNYNHKYIPGISKHDHTRIHKAYWEDYHINNKK